MSFDLFFYKNKDTALSGAQIASYLTDNLVPKSEPANQWFFANSETEVYFSFDQNEPDDGLGGDESPEDFDGFDDTRFSFNLNFMRPSFFGLEAFRFVERFLTDLNLFVFNPQSGTENPYKATRDELFENWNKTNLQSSVDYFDKMGGSYLPLEKSNDAWEYNFNRKKLMATLGGNHFVPRLFFFKQKRENKVFTLTTWGQDIPTVIPPADYFLLTRQYKKWFKTVNDKVLISKQTLLGSFHNYLDDFDFKGCKIIHPTGVNTTKALFLSLKSEQVLEEFADRMQIDKLYNAKPD
jgi:hypothetical protein